MIVAYGLHFEQPWWLACGLLAVPIATLAWRSLGTIGVARRVASIALRVLVIFILAAALARPSITETHDRVALLTVMDRSQSVPQPLQKAAREYLLAALADRPAGDLLAVIDVAEQADIVQLPGPLADIPTRTLTLVGNQSRIAAGLQMALAVAPPGAAIRILLISDGNETAGDLRAVAKVAAANNIPIDVLPLRYKHDREVVFRRLVAPGKARSGQTVPVRFVLSSTAACKGKVLLSLNGQAVDLDAAGDAVTAPVTLKPGTNVHTVSMPLGDRGFHQFEASFIPDDPNADRLSQNNRASAFTFVSGPGHVLVVSNDSREAQPLLEALKEARIDARPTPAGAFPTELTGMLGVDALVLVNTPNHLFSQAQQELICRYVTDLGGGMVMVGGPKSFGAGHWLGSPVARIVPVDMDPPQKKQMPRGTLVLVIDRSGSMSGAKLTACKQAAIAALRGLSRLDYVGVVEFDDGATWRVPIQLADNKGHVSKEIRKIAIGGGTDVASGMKTAADGLRNHKSGVKHVILLTDGQSAGEPCMPIAKKLLDEHVTVSTVAVGDDAARDLLFSIARMTKGRFYPVDDLKKLPQIFVKEAQVVRRSLIVENTFRPRVASSLNEILRGVTALPPLEGRVLTGPKGGLSEVVLATPDSEPLLATEQAGLGRVAAFTSSADSRWAAQWLAWGGFNRFWEQTVRWAAKSPQATDCEVFADVQGRDVTLTVEAYRPGGTFIQLAQLEGQAIAPDLQATPLELRQVGPGRYRASFTAAQGGCHLINLQYRKSAADAKPLATQTVVNIPFAAEFDDLTDDAALLAHVAQASGGRILDADPERAELFSRAGLARPVTAMPLTLPLLLAWVVAFLLDVAVRRIAVDFAAIARRLGLRTPELAGVGALAAAGAALIALTAAGLRPLRLGLTWHIVIAGLLLVGASAWLLRNLIFGRALPAVSDATLAALKARRKSVQQRLKAEGRTGQTARKFTAPKGAASSLPEADVSTKPASRRPPPAVEQKKPAPAADKDQTHVSRLLDAKRRAKRK